MEVAPTPPSVTPPKAKKPTKPILLRDYWRRYKRMAIAATIGMQCAVAVVVSLSLLVGGMQPTNPVFFITLFTTLLTSGTLNVLLVHSIITPHRDIINAVVNNAGEQPLGPLANPNTRRYTKNGFRPVLQYVYEMAAGQSQAKTTDTADTQQLRLLTTALNNTRAGIIVMNGQGDIQYANSRAPVVTNSNNIQQLELLFDQHDQLTDWLATCQQSAVHSDKTWQRVANKIVGDEDRRIFDISASYEKGSAAEVVLVLFDHTATYKPEDDELDFISFAAHELRGPITVIRGYLDVLDIELEATLAPDQKELMKRLIVSANRLSGYINNILNTSKYDRRHLKINLAEEHLADIYDLIQDDMNLRASSQNRLLSVTIPRDLPTIAADRSSLSEVLSNLIDNALKYSDEGGAVAVSAAIKNPSTIEVSVQDNGIGMPSNVVGNLFHKFYRSHRSRETVAGTGIGLYICKAIVESHGGTIGVSSVEGAGSTFSFTVPIYASVAEKLQANDHTNAGLMSDGTGWIKNHSKYSG
ncbi:MAG: HAMP domain-containing sensor histidine kinase [Candidatus Saccharimonas sp.]